ncbi:MAG: hypothetical protein SPG61_07885, partial [Arcanobacterium sp.]|nr:hypothetical protein [Arcanobacterium sp.]
MLNARIAIRRKEQFRDEEAALLVQLNQLEGVSLQTLQLFNLYDIFQATPEELHLLESRIARDAIIDDVVPSSELDG